MKEKTDPIAEQKMDSCVTNTLDQVEPRLNERINEENEMILLDKSKITFCLIKLC